MRIGFIGSGWVASQHLAAMQQIEEAEVVAMSDPDRARAEGLAAQVGATVYDRWADMLSKEKLDAAYIMVPPHVHGEIEKAVAEHVPAVLIEKPIANNMETAESIRECFRKAGTIVSVAYMNRYRKAVARAREVFGGDDKAVVVNGWWVEGMPPPLWWRQKQESGGQMVEQATHLVDLGRYIVGEIVEVSAYGATGFIRGVEKYSVQDATVMNVRFESGAVGNFTAGCFIHEGLDGATLGIGMSISSRGASLRFDRPELDTTILHGAAHSEHIAPEPNVFEIEDRTFLQAVAEKNPSLIRSPYADAIKTLRVTLAANESIETGKPVKIQ